MFLLYLQLLLQKKKICFNKYFVQCSEKTISYPKLNITGMSVQMFLEPLYKKFMQILSVIFKFLLQEETEPHGDGNKQIIFFVTVPKLVEM